MPLRLSLLALAAATLTACQSAPAATTIPIAKTTPKSPAKPVAKNTPAPAPTPPGGYSHDAANKLFRAAKYTAAEAMCQQAVAAIERKSSPTDPALADPLNDLATVYLRIGRFDDARKLVDRAQPLLSPDIRDQAIVLARVLTNKAWRHYAWGETGAAQKYFTQARDLLEKNGQAQSLDMAEVINDLGLIMGDGDDKEQADGRRLLFRAWEMRRKLASDLSPEAEESLSNLGMNMLFHSEASDDALLAINTLNKALDTAEKVFGPDHPETAMARANVAMADQMIDQTDKAESEIRKALAVSEKAFGPVSLDRASELQILGTILQAQEKFPEAETAFKESVAINESVFGPNHPFVGSALTYLQSLYEAMHDDAKTKQVKERAEKLRGTDL